MGNGSCSRLFFAAASAALIGGCDIGAAARPAADPAPRVEQPRARHQVDAARNRVWFLTEEGVFLHDASRAERIAVPVPGWVFAGAPYGCLPDLALGPKGEAVVTSDIVPTLWRIDPDTLAVTVHPLALDADRDKDVGFSGLVYSPQRGAFFAVSYQHGSLWRIDPQLQRAEKIALSAPLPRACGLAVHKRSSQQVLGRIVDLCARTPQAGWSVLFAPDWRSAYVSAAPCRDQPWPLEAMLG